ncbi:helix-turn-helix protein [Murinocardiopsis flavida]|uniref:Helix-turn-helix protein n=1 Tax=Murinocardiopsis flavida TaxID=645275 RepID=A0A2P8CSY6_9ACTN|nr:helix-turn-helix domain-containing protein [Murinocardiopsis flavida]PSK88078.1 helix-turn-helix protein [Murinocardiopsis flavida]
MDMALRRELGAHLRAARAQVAPRDVGLDGGGRRRAPGLRREEVAALSGVSVAWYTWLEQGRVTTSRQVIDAVCRALRMAPDAHRHALSLAGFRTATPLGQEGGAAVGAATQDLIDAWPTTPALVLDARLDILASNAAYRRFWGDPGDAPQARRNLLLRLASDAGDGRRLIGGGPLLRGLYRQFRAATGHEPDDPRAAEIVGLLAAERPDAAHWWRCRAVADFAPTTVDVADAGADGAAFRLAFALLRPVAEPGGYILTQTPGDTATRGFFARCGAA